MNGNALLQESENIDNFETLETLTDQFSIEVICGGMLNDHVLNKTHFRINLTSNPSLADRERIVNVVTEETRRDPWLYDTRAGTCSFSRARTNQNCSFAWTKGAKTSKKRENRREMKCALQALCASTSL